MQKVPTLYTRDFRGHVIDVLSEFVISPGSSWVATEKLDGANVRLTVRSGKLVRLEVRKIPSREQRVEGIFHPWYRDAMPEGDNHDYWLWQACHNTNLMGVPDGEWEGEAVGPKIQKNALKLDKHVVYLFSLHPWRDGLGSNILIPPVVPFAPMSFEELFDYFIDQQSVVNPAARMEGLVYWFFDEPVAKIKASDFDYSILEDL